jgi:hypothetical protein
MTGNSKLILGPREPLVGVKRPKRPAELILELPTEIMLKVGSDGTSTVKRKGIWDLLIPYPDGVNGINR